MRFTLGFKLFVAFVFLVSMIGGLAVNQYLQAKTLETQNKFDTTVLLQNEKLTKDIQNIITKEIRQVNITPTPTLLPLRKVIPTITVK